MCKLKILIIYRTKCTHELHYQLGILRVVLIPRVVLNPVVVREFQGFSQPFNFQIKKKIPRKMQYRSAMKRRRETLKLNREKREEEKERKRLLLSREKEKRIETRRRKATGRPIQRRILVRPIQKERQRETPAEAREREKKERQYDKVVKEFLSACGDGNLEIVQDFVRKGTVDVNCNEMVRHFFYFQEFTLFSLQ